LQKLPHNKVCADCGEKLPQYVNLTHATFVCMVCSGVHREFSHRVKGISLSEFSTEEVEIMRQGGNELDRATYLARYNSSSDVHMPQPGDTSQIRTFIRAKYEEKRWVASSDRRHSESAHSRPREGSVEKPKRDHHSHEKTKGHSSSVPREKSIHHPKDKQEKTQPSSANDLIDIFSSPQPEINFKSNQQAAFQNSVQPFPQQHPQPQGPDWANFGAPQPKATGFETQSFNNFSNPFGGFDNFPQHNGYQNNFPSTTVNNGPNSGFNELGATNKATITPGGFDQFGNTNGFPTPMQQPIPFQNTQLSPTSDQNTKMQAFEELIEQEKQEKMKQQRQQSILYGGASQQQTSNNFFGATSSNPFANLSIAQTNVPQDSMNNWGHSTPGFQQFPGSVPPVQPYQQQYYSQPYPVQQQQPQLYQTSATSPFDELLQSNSQTTGNANNQKQQQKPQLFTEFGLNQLPKSSNVTSPTTKPVGNPPFGSFQQTTSPQQSSGNPFDDLF